MFNGSFSDEATASGVRRRPRFLSLAVSALAASAMLTAMLVGSAAATDAVRQELDTLDVLQLGCEGRERDDLAVIACRWTVPERAVGVRVLRLARGSGDDRKVVHRTGDPWSNTFIDTDIRRGVRYLYVVQAVGAAGQIVATSRPSIAGVAELPDLGVEVLRLACSATGSVTVRCAWSAPTVPARTLTLWRSVDGAIRERVATFAQPFPTSYGGIVPESTSQAVYAVVVTDGSGEVVARSRADVVNVDGPMPTVGVEPAPAVMAADPAPVAPVAPATVPATSVPATIPPSSAPADRVRVDTVAPEPTFDVVIPPATTTPRPVEAEHPATRGVHVESDPEPVRVAVVERERAD